MVTLAIGDHLNLQYPLPEAGQWSCSWKFQASTHIVGPPGTQSPSGSYLLISINSEKFGGSLL